MNETTTPLISETLNKSSQIITSIDPNWFYSSLAQSSAAIVGIIGAFFTTRVINQRIQINQLNKEIKEKQSKIKFLKESILEKEEYVKKIDEEDNLEYAKNFLEKIKEEINLDNPLKIEEIIKKGNNEENDDFHNLSKTTLSKLYPQFLENLKKERKKKKLLYGLLPNINYDFVGALPNIRKYDTYNRYCEEIQNVKLDINYLTYEIKNKEEDLIVLKKGVPLLSTLCVLFGFSIIGVFVPLFMLTQSLEAMELWRSNIFYIVFSAWILLTIFFLIEILVIKYNWRRNNKKAKERLD